MGRPLVELAAVPSLCPCVGVIIDTEILVRATDELAVVLTGPTAITDALKGAEERGAQPDFITACIAQGHADINPRIR